MQEFTPIKEGKVREVYDIGDSLIIVDRQDLRIRCDPEEPDHEKRCDTHTDVKVLV